MNSHSRLILVVAILLSSLQIALSLKAIQFGNELKDIYSITGTCFTTEAATWQVNQKFGTNVYNDGCNGYGIVGGYNVLKAYGDYYYKKYTGLPTHTMIYYTMTIYAIDSWSYGAVAGGDDHFGLQFDTKPVIDGFRFNIYTFYENVCGVSTWNDLRNIRVFGRIAHAGTEVTLKILHLLDQDSTDESVAFREVNLIFANVSPLLSDSMCGTAPFKGFTGECACPEGQYSASGTCTNCHANCESCWGPSASECYQCRPGTSWISGACTACATGCASCHGTTDTDCDACLTGYYFFNSQSCIYPCAAPLTQGTTTCTATTCSSPCTTITDYYYWDGTCAATCDFPYRQNSINKYVKTCEFPCAAGSFLYWDGTCSTACLAPNTQRTTKGQLFCDFPCPDSEFAYWNGTCATDCLPPFVQSKSNGRQFCEYPCEPTEYLYWNGSCVATCDFPLSTRVVKGNRYCDYPCKNAEFLYWDGSCEADCPSLLFVRVEGTPRSRNYCDWLGGLTDFLYWDGNYHATCNPLYTQRTFKGRKYCEYPCDSTDLTQFLYWDGSCRTGCDLPLEQEIESPGIQFCKFRCTTPTDYLYWDNSCSSTCDYPLTSKTIGGGTPRKECTYPCLATEVLYYNGTCGSSCLIPFTSGSVGGYTTCQYPCDYTEFLFYNGSCKSNCPFPYALRKTNGLGFCDYPCTSSQFLFWNGTCVASCESPLRKSDGPNGEHYCNIPCDSPLDYYYIATEECKSTCDVRSRKEGDLYLICLPPDAPVEAEGFLDLMLTPNAEPNAPSLLVTNRYTQYLKYLDISMPNRLETYSSSRARNVISLKMNVKMPSGLASFFSERSLEAVTETDITSPSFVINFFGDIVLLVSIAIAALVFQVMEVVFNSLGHMRALAFCKKLRYLTMWNLCFGLIALNADDIIIYSYIEISNVSFTSAGGSVSLIVSIIMIVLVLGVVVLALYVVLRFRAFRKEVRNNKGDLKCMEFHNGWKRFQVLYRGYSETSFIKNSFYIMYILRTIIPQAVIVGFVGSPKIQIIAQIAVSAVILAYIILLRPIKKKVNLVQLICLEAAGLAINIAAFILVTIPPSDDGTVSSSHARTFLGDLIILGGLFVNVVIVVFLVLKLVLTSYELYKHFKANPKADRTVWLGLLVIPLQQGAFGFEEFMGENLLDIEPEKVDNPYGKPNIVFPDMPSPPISNKAQDVPQPEIETLALEKQFQQDEENTSPGLPKNSTISNIERMRRVTKKKTAKEGTLADIRESSNASPAFDLNVSPETSGLGTSFGMSPTKSSQLLKGGASHHFDFDNKDDSPVRKRATRLQALKELTKK